MSGREKAARDIRPEPNGSVIAAEPQPFRAVPLMRPQMEATLHDQPMSGVMFGSRCAPFRSQDCALARRAAFP